MDFHVFSESAFRSALRALLKATLLAPKPIIEPLTDSIDSMLYLPSGPADLPSGPADLPSGPDQPSESLRCQIGTSSPDQAELSRRISIAREEFAAIDVPAEYRKLSDRLSPKNHPSHDTWESTWDASTFAWKFLMTSADRDAFVTELFVASPFLSESIWPNVRSAPRLAVPGEFRPLWADDWWDGPLSGYGRLASGRLAHFATLVELDDPNRQRIFGAYSLTAEQEAEAVRWNDLFREKVSTQCDIDERGARLPGVVRPEATWNEFYACPWRPKKLEPKNLPLLGWFWIDPTIRA